MVFFMYSKKKSLPIGVSQFRDVLENYYYVDKTWLLHELLEEQAKVTLFTRPRRFGKTLNMSMMREFFDITQDSTQLFRDLKIANSPYYREINGYPVLYISFRDSRGGKEFILADMIHNIRLEYWHYKELADCLDKNERAVYDKILEVLEKEDVTALPTIAKSLSVLTQFLYKYYKKQVIVMIDEYDTPMEEAYVEGVYEELRGFFRMLYASVLKDNPNLKMGILTGIQRIAKESIFSGLNNLNVNTVRDSRYSSYFGLTMEETKTILEYYEMEVKEEVRDMYNGYNFGGCLVYNPWSIINYINSKELRTFWVNTASNTMIKHSIIESDDEFKTEFEFLISGGEAQVTLDIYTAYQETSNASTLWGLLLNAGYITLVDTRANVRDLGRMTRDRIRIPNEEVKMEFQNIIASYTKLGESTLRTMFDALIFGEDYEEFKQIYKRMVLKMTSYYDAKENAYHMLFLGMCSYLEPYYEVRSNIEAGHGRSDIILKAKRPSLKHFVIEFKEGDEVAQLANKAIDQIKDREYASSLHGDVMYMGVAHNKKMCEIIIEQRG